MIPPVYPHDISIIYPLDPHHILYPLYHHYILIIFPSCTFTSSFYPHHVPIKFIIYWNN